MQKNDNHVALVWCLVACTFFFCGDCQGADPLDPEFYEKDKTIKHYLESIDRKFDEGLGHATDLKGEISTIKAEQYELDKRNIVNTYELRIIKAEQGVIRTRVGILEERSEEQKALNNLLAQGLERLNKGMIKSLNFVETVTGLGGAIMGIITTVIAGLIVNYIKKRGKKNVRS